MDVVYYKNVFHQKPNQENYPYASSAQIFHSNQLFISSEKLETGLRASAPHFHKEIDEIIYIVEGELMAHEDNDARILRKGDFVCFHANSNKKHYLENQSGRVAEFLIFRKSLSVSDVQY